LAGGGIPQDFDQNVVESIQDRLCGVERDHDVSLILAVESGSRAWGFSSTDSDYDCRFIYRHRPDRYLSLWHARDVIETPLDHIYDINGWEIGKALRLLVKGNAVAIEWLTSPISYRKDPPVRDILADFARRYSDPEGVRRHYFHLATQQFQRHLVPNDQWKVKTLFYALRPIAALRWLRLHPAEVVLPMNLWELMSGAEMSAEIIEIARSYAELKAAMPEQHDISSDQRLLSLIAAELSIAQDLDVVAGSADAERALAADCAFLEIIRMPWPSEER